MDKVSARQRDERSIAQKPAFLRNRYQNRGKLRAPGARSTSYSLNSDAISSKGGVADQALQNGALLTAEGIDAISANNAVSPFLSLPQEVKDRIYELACGGNLIHIHYSTELSHHICQAVVTENDNYNILDTTKSPSVASDVTKRHDHCFNCRYADLGLFQRVSPAKHNYNLELRFLRSCKQLHWEAKSTPFTSNTFSFEQPYIVDALLARKPHGARVPHATSIRTVRLEMLICDAGDQKICFGALTTMASQLKSLKRLYVDLEFRRYVVSLPGSYNFDPFQKQFMKHLVSLRLPQLRTFTLILSEGPRGTARPIIDRKQDWGEYVKDVLRPTSREGDSLDGHLAI